MTTVATKASSRPLGLIAFLLLMLAIGSGVSAYVTGEPLHTYLAFWMLGASYFMGEQKSLGLDGLAQVPRFFGLGLLGGLSIVTGGLVAGMRYWPSEDHMLVSVVGGFMAMAVIMDCSRWKYNFADRALNG